MSTPQAILLFVVLSQAAYIAGELLLKAAMNRSHGDSILNLHFVAPFVGGCLAILTSFLIWLALLAEAPLSYLFPFQSLNPVLIGLGSAIFLKEKITPRLMVAILLVTIGVGLVMTSE